MPAHCESNFKLSAQLLPYCCTHSVATNSCLETEQLDNTIDSVVINIDYFYAPGGFFGCF